ncbi:hypothetical protein BEN78_08115 [Xanthomonas citri pv. mangiferaeindicae]|nr:hypothetical protein BEN78_08115 [Xanthomonas citri pv. mangiferaeindicae]
MRTTDRNPHRASTRRLGNQAQAHLRACRDGRTAVEHWLELHLRDEAPHQIHGLRWQLVFLVERVARHSAIAFDIDGPGHQHAGLDLAAHLARVLREHRRQTQRQQREQHNDTPANHDCILH